MTEYETQFLGQLIDDNDLYFKFKPKDFWFSGEGKPVFKIVRELIEGKGCSLLQVADRIGEARAARLSVSSTANSAFYAEKLAAAGKLRELKSLGAYISEAKNVNEIIEEAHRRLDMVLTGAEDYEIKTAQEIAFEAITHIEERYSAAGELPGYRTGFSKLDNFLLGLQPQRLYVIGARPSQGKSAMMMNIVQQMACALPCGVINLESANSEFILRYMSHTSKMKAGRLYTGFLSKSDMSKVLSSAEQVYNAKLQMYDKPNCSLPEVKAQARRMVQKGAKVIFIDYLQLIQTDADSDRERVAKVSKQIKDLSRELSIPIVALAQLRRDSDGRRPGLGDFQHTSQIEQDADAGILIYHYVTDMAGKDLKKAKVDDPDQEQRNTYLIVEKNRDGETGAIPMDFQPETLSFYEKSVDR